MTLTRSDAFRCPRCGVQQFLLRMSEPYEEPRWYIECVTCQHVYELIPNGTIQEVPIYATSNQSEADE